MQSHAAFIVWASGFCWNFAKTYSCCALLWPCQQCKLSLLMLRVQWRTSPRKWKFLFPTRGELCCVFWSHTHTGRASAIWHLCLFCFPSVHLSREDRRPCIEKHGLELPGQVPFTWAPAAIYLHWTAFRSMPWKSVVHRHSLQLLVLHLHRPQTDTSKSCCVRI